MFRLKYVNNNKSYAYIHQEITNLLSVIRSIYGKEICREFNRE